MSERPVLRRLLNSVSCRAADVFFGWRHKRRWLNKEGLGGMHQSYFDAYRDRLPIATTVAGLLATEGIQEASILEFGCSGGNNLKLLREQIAAPIRYCGLDIQEDAIAFARAQFPTDSFHVCSTEDLPALRPRLEHADVVLISGVLYYLPQKEAQDVLNFSASMAKYLVVCDILDRFDERQGENDGLFLHPFRSMCAEAGMSITRPLQAPKEGDRHGIFVAQVDPIKAVSAA